MTCNEVEIEITDNEIFTNGLMNTFNFELRLQIKSDVNLELEVLRYLINYILSKEFKTIKNFDTITYGVWLLKFIKNEAYYDIYELDDMFENWVIGGYNAAKMIKLQRETCSIVNVEPLIPFFTQKIAISRNVINGYPLVEGVRYEEPIHMSGWYITDKTYDGDVTNIEVVSLETFIKKRMDLVEFLTLPFDYAFQTLENHQSQIWKVS
jgi:hypothetical protein